MANLNPLELEQLKLLLSGKGLMGEKISTLDLLRSRFPSFLSNLKPGLTEENLKDNNFLIKYLSNPYNRNKIKDALRKEFSLSSAQKIEIEESLKEPTITGTVSVQPSGQAVPIEQAAPIGTTTSATAGGIPFGMPAAPTFSAPRVVRNIPQTPHAPETPKIAITTSEGKLVETPPSRLVNPQGRFNFSAFRSKVGGGITNTIKTGLEKANPFLKRAGNGLVNGLTSIANPGGIGGTGSRSILGKFSRGSGNFFGRLGKGSGGRGGLVFAISILGFMVLVGGLTAFAPSPTPGSAAPLPNPTGTDISSCKFTRAGNSLPLKSSIFIGWINNAAAAAGVPPQVLASVAMHENPGFTANADNNHDAIKSNQLCNKGTIFCEKNGRVLHSIEGQNDPCTTTEIANGARTAQAVGLMQLLDIYNQGKDLCSITENLAIAAAKLKADGITSQPTQDQVNTAISSYYGGTCAYGSFSYCNEVWQDLQNCQAIAGAPVPPGPIGFSLSCPLGNNFTVTCGTAVNPVNNCGHGDSTYLNGAACNPTYYVCNGIRYSDALYRAIDVIGNTVVTLPFVNGNEVAEWTRIDDQPIPIGGGSWGYKINYQTNYKGKTLVLDLTHINNQISSAKTLKSGEQAGTMFAGIGHLHTGLSVDNTWVEPIQEAKMCAK